MVNRTCNERGLIQEECELHIGFDGGQGSLKVALSITASTPKSNMGRSKYSEVNWFLFHTKDIYWLSLYSYKQGITPRDAKDSSVKRVLILAIVPDCPESHFNVMQILNNLNLENLRCTFAVDVKMGNSQIYIFIYINFYFIRNAVGWKVCGKAKVWLSVL